MGLRGGAVGSVSKLKKSLKRKASSQVMNISNEGIVVRFLTDPEGWVEFFEHYDEPNKTYVLCSDDCEFCSQGMRPSKRYLANVVDTEESKAVALRIPVSAANALMKKYDRYTTLLDRDYSMLKDGTGYDTTYDVNPEPPTKINVKRYELTDLWALLQKMFAEQEETGDDDDEEDAAPPAKRSRSTSRTMTKKKVARRDEDDEDEEEEDDDYEPPVKRKPIKKSVGKPAAKKKLAKRPPY